MSLYIVNHANDSAIILNGQVVMTYDPEVDSGDVAGLINETASSLSDIFKTPVKTLDIPDPICDDWNWNDVREKHFSHTESELSYLLTVNDFDHTGFPTTSREVTLTQAAIQDVVCHAMQFVTVVNAIGQGQCDINDFDQVLSELEGALTASDLLEESRTPLPCFVIAKSS